MATTIIKTIINHGIKPGEGSYGFTITVTGAGQINSPNYAILGLLGGATIVNDGILHGDAFGILMPFESHILNQGHIYGVTAAVGLGSGATLINDGTVAGGSAYGVGLIGSATLDNAGLVSAKGIGVYLNFGTLNNSGTDFGATAGAVMINGQITNTGAILGNSVGLDMANGAAVNHGTITGQLSGVGVLAGSFTNYGIIAGTTAGLGLLGGSVTNAATGVINGSTIGVALSASLAPALLTNDGIITGDDGMYMVQGTLANAGSIAGQTIGVYLDQGTITNTGQISGARDGIGVTAGLIDNQGVIIGGTDGVYLAGGNLTNAGTISGGSYAVYGQQSFDLTVSAGAVFAGQVMDASGDGTISLDSSRGGTLSGIGTSFAGFSALNFQPNIFQRGSWVVEDNLVGLQSLRTIQNFYAGNTIVITDFAATSATYAVGAGLVLSNGAVTETLSIASANDDGVYAQNGHSYILNDPQHGANHFELVPGDIRFVSVSTSLSVTPGQNNYATGVTIGSNVTVSTTAGPAIFVPERVTNSRVINYGDISAPSAGTGISFAAAGYLENYGTINTYISVQQGRVTNVGVVNGGVFGGTLFNLGTITSTVNDYTVTNTGTIEGAVLAHTISSINMISNDSANGIGVSCESGFFGSGQITGGYTGVSFLDENSTLQNFGNIEGGTVGVDEFTEYTANSLGVYNYGRIGGGADGIRLALGGAITNAGTIAGGTYAIDSGSNGNYTPLYLTVGRGALFNGKVLDTSGHGHLSLADRGATRNASLLDMGGSFCGFSDIAFTGRPDWTLGGTAAELAAGQTITGFADGDTIDLEGFAATASTFISGTGLLLSDGARTETIGITGSFSTADFGIASDGNGGTEIVACFAAGTRIATARGKTPVERLRIGDLVKTHDAGLQKIKWIGARAYAAPFANHHLVLPIHIRAHAFARNVPSRLLTVSPGHGMFVDGVIVPAWRLVNNVSITQAAHVEQITYFHVELESHAIIFAENCPAESFLDDDCRNQFHNAAEFYRLYPADQTASSSCCPRVESGYRLRAIQNRLNSRAGIARAPCITGPLRGFIDQAGPDRITGWAQDVGAPEVPVALDLFCNGIRIARILANLYRADLRAAGLGSGCHAFDFPRPAGTGGEIEILRAADGAPLTGMRDHQTLRAML